MAVACIPPEDTDRVISFDEDTVMGEIQAAGELVVGIPNDFPPLAMGRGIDTEGFARDLSELVAGSLGVDVTFVTYDSADEMLDLVDRSDDGRADQSLAGIDRVAPYALDVAFPLVPITERRARTLTFTDPYWVGHQRLLVAKGASVDATSDLAGRSVCAAVDPSTGLDVRRLVPDVGPLTIQLEPVHCLDPKGGITSDAVTASDLFLVNMMAESRRPVAIVGEQLSTEGYGAVVERGADAFADFVNDVWAEAKDEGVWQELYDKWFGRYLGNDALDEPIDMTVEEAAALFPREYD